MAATAIDAYVEHAVEMEGKTDFLYLCTASQVTTGIGKVLATPEAALRVAWLEDGAKAGEARIRADWQAIRGISPAGTKQNAKAESFAPKTRIRLAPGEAERLLAEHLAENERALRARFAEYDSLPRDVRLALLDMIYNLGEGGLTGKFPSFCEAIAAKDWARAAAECERRGIGDARNAWVKGLLLGAAQAA
jgi:GH24 family phage-related lysozyme (muramidase)